MAFVTDYDSEMADAHCGVGVVHLGAIENGCRMTVALVLAGEGITSTIKRLTNRPRPYQQLETSVADLNGVRIYQPGPFEKADRCRRHTANIVAFALWLPPSTNAGASWCGSWRSRSRIRVSLETTIRAMSPLP